MNSTAVLRSLSLLFFVYLGLTFSASGQKKRPQNTTNSCREFVVEFYSWYLASAPKENQGRASDVALNSRPYLFSPAIVKALREDSEAQEKAGADLVSLDGDPFVGADGFAERYIVEKTTTRQDGCRAEVHAVWDGKEDEASDIIPELEVRNGNWRFVNFYFPSAANPKGWDLLSELRALREGENINDRKQAARTLHHYIQLRLHDADWQEYSKLVAWPDEPGWDCKWVVSNDKIGAPRAKGQALVIPVAYNRLGLFCYDFDFKSEPKVVTISYELVKHTSGWKVVAPIPDYPDINGDVLIKSLNARAGNLKETAERKAEAEETARKIKKMLIQAPPITSVPE